MARVEEMVPLLVTLVATGVALAVTHAVMRLRERAPGRGLVARQVAMLIVTGLGAVGVVLALPVSDALKGQLLGLLGVALTGVVAFASTTFVANAMAGLMLRAVGNFRPGDWLRVGDQFGRVTERGIFHTEIQTDQRDLATLPNLYLVTNPVQVVASSGTIVTTTLSLGYDLDHGQIEALLTQAAEASGLEEPFVRIVELGDVAVTYRVAGFLRDVEHLLSVRSRLQASVLDTLHGGGVEIVSPAFMNQRRLADDARFIPARRVSESGPQDSSPEERIFDKAEKASIDELRVEREALAAEIDAFERAHGDAGGASASGADVELREKRDRIAAIDARLAQASDESGGT